MDGGIFSITRHVAIELEEGPDPAPVMDILEGGGTRICRSRSSPDKAIKSAKWVSYVILSSKVKEKVSNK